MEAMLKNFGGVVIDAEKLPNDLDDMAIMAVENPPEDIRILNYMRRCDTFYYIKQDGIWKPFIPAKPSGDMPDWLKWMEKENLVEFKPFKAIDIEKIESNCYIFRTSGQKLNK